MARRDFEGGQLTCSFCGKSQREVRKLIAGPTVYICDECIRLCTDIIDEETVRETESEGPSSLPTPQELSERLDEYVVGQSQAKKILSVAVYNHYKRINHNLLYSEEGEELGEAIMPDRALLPELNDEEVVELSKSNVLLVGPTGTGKTLLAQTMARMLDVPFTIADATTLTEAGYVGEDVENIISNLLIAADNDVSRAERGIIYIDEIDKIARKAESISMTRDVSGEGVQQALLKIIEGTKATVTPRGSKKYPQAEAVQIDTTNILVICGGSFTGIEHTIRKRTGRKGLGFGAQLSVNEGKGLGQLLKSLEPEDLQAYGLIPEFIGRVPVIVTLDELEEEDLVRILTEPKNALVRQYQKLFAMERVELSFNKGAVAAVARQAIASKSGARGLRSILETAMLDIMYEIPFLENLIGCEITEEVISSNEAPELRFEEKKRA